MRRPVLALGASLLAQPAVAFEVGSTGARVDTTSTTVGAYHTNNDNGLGCDDDYIDLFERLNIVGQLAPWSAGLRLDAGWFSSTPKPGEGSPPCNQAELVDRYFNEVIPEKVWLAYTGRRLEITAGDSYVQFGRGLALSLRKIDELGVDTSLRGAKVLAHVGPLDGTLVAGITNTGNVDEATGRHADDPLDVVAGGRIEIEAPGRVRPGMHVVVFDFRNGSELSGGADEYDEVWVNTGATLSASRLLPNVDLYLEWINQRRSHPSGDVRTGAGAYGTVTTYAGRATILVEGKAYGDLASVQPDIQDGPTDTGLPQEFNTVRYTAPPTVERVLQKIVNPQQDIAGGRTQLDWRFTPTVSAFASYGVFRDNYELGGAETPATTIHDPYAGVDLRWNDARSRALISFGERFVVTDEVAGAPPPEVKSDLHADVEVSQVLTRSLSAEARWQHDDHLDPTEPPGGQDPTQVPPKYRKGTIQAGLRLAPWAGLAGVLDYSSETSSVDDRRGHPFGQLKPGGVVDVSPTPSSTIRLFAGGTTGGLRCVSGVCRVFPPFEGVKLTATVRF